MNPPFDNTNNLLYDRAVKYEWLETNGLGGYASSTIIGTHTRRYHGLLVASLNPPVERSVLLAHLDETLEFADQRFELSTHQYYQAVNPHGFQYLTQYRRGFFPEFIYEAGGIKLKKTIAAIHGENTTVIQYEVLEAPGTFQMELLPLYAMRDFHGLRHAHGSPAPRMRMDEEVLSLTMGEEGPEVFLQFLQGEWVFKPDWYYNFEYLEEMARGQGAHEDLFTPGYLELTLEAGDIFALVVSTESPRGRDGLQLLAQEQVRRENLISATDVSDAFMQHMTLAADQFVVRRGTEGESILAGYHWFSDWGRDTMISLPGICLSQGRMGTAKAILREYASHVSEGMLPNRFNDYGQAPHYNNADANLWFFVAIYQYFLATRDEAFIFEEMLPVMEEMLWWHERGTRHQIHAQEDGLLFTGEPGVAVTWMDAKVGDWVVTPRIGKCVEINALWFNAWMILAYFYNEKAEVRKSEKMLARGNQIRESFLQTFWNPYTRSLYDYVNDHIKDDALRPNQLFAISLPFPLLEPQQAADVLQVVEEKLYTPVGLRSLAPDHPAYIGRYQGDQVSRDAAYHQGTVWTWLLGPYIDALIKVRGIRGHQQAQRVINALESHLSDAGIGSLSEIFDAEAPFTPRGCIAQAWSVAEVLRTVHRYQLRPVHTPAVAAPATRKNGWRNQKSMVMDS